MTTKTLPAPQVETASPQRYSHLVDADKYPVLGTLTTALCGYTWIPEGRGDGGYPWCQKCEDLRTYPVKEN